MSEESRASAPSVILASSFTRCATLRCSMLNWSMSLCSLGRLSMLNMNCQFAVQNE